MAYIKKIASDSKPECTNSSAIIPAGQAWEATTRETPDDGIAIIIHIKLAVSILERNFQRAVRRGVLRGENAAKRSPRCWVVFRHGDTDDDWWKDINHALWPMDE